MEGLTFSRWHGDVEGAIFTERQSKTLDRKLSEVVKPCGWHSLRIWAFLESLEERANQNLNLFMVSKALAVKPSRVCMSLP